MGRRPRRIWAAVGCGLAVAAASVLATGVAATGSAAVADGRLPVALIGCGGMGRGHLERLVKRDDVRVTHLCDVALLPAAP